VKHKPLSDLSRVFSGEHDLRPRERALLAVLILRRDNNSGACFPGQARIAAEIGLVPRTVRRIIKGLEARGVLSRTAHRGQASRYSLHLDRLQDPTEPGAAPSTPDICVHPGREAPPRTPTSGHPGQGSAPTPDATVPQSAVSSAPELLSPPERAPRALKEDGGRVDESEKIEHLSAKDLVAIWLQRSAVRPPAAAVEKQGAAAKRLVRDFDAGSLSRALDGMDRLFPHSKGEPFDLFDLERKMAKALEAQANVSARGRATARQSHIDEKDILDWNSFSGSRGKGP